MMSLEVISVSSKKELIEFIKFPMRLYRENQYYVPPIINFELSTLLEEKNPAFEHCEASYWIIKRKDEIVGRIAGILHQEEFKQTQKARFGWIDFIDDHQVSELLFETVIAWVLKKKAKYIHGPLGFTDLDFEGMLINGFDQMATQATIYNFPYYAEHLEKLGFSKSVDWVEIRGRVPDELPRKLSRTAALVESRFGISSKRFRSAKEILKYADGAFDVLNRAYQDLYGYYPLTKKQIDYYIKQYFEFVRKEYISIIVNSSDEVVALAISFPSLSKAFQKSNGSLFPFGFLHILKAFRSNDHLDMFLIGVDPAYQKLGANVLIFNELIKAYQKNGVKYVSTGPMLEENRSVLNLWNEFGDQLDPVDIRRRCFQKNISE